MKDEISIQYYKSPYGELLIGSHEGSLCLLDWRYWTMRQQVDIRIQQGLDAEYVEQSSDVIVDTIKQLKQYDAKEHIQFDVPIKTVGSDFQKKVWKALQEIPYGETTTYTQLAHSISNDKAVRAVASANGANALSIIIPCHRVIASNGDLAGYAGGLQAKKQLLQLESQMVF